MRSLSCHVIETVPVEDQWRLICVSERGEDSTVAADLRVVWREVRQEVRRKVRRFVAAVIKGREGNELT